MDDLDIEVQIDWAMMWQYDWKKKLSHLKCLWYCNLVKSMSEGSSESVNKHFTFHFNQHKEKNHEL